jgi:hypothetical protein
VIVRTAARDRNFTIVPNGLIADDRLSWETRGLLVYLLSKPDHWQVNTKHLTGAGPGGVDRIRRMINEAIDVGYMVRRRLRNERGVYSGDEVVVYDAPVSASDSVEASTGKARPGDTSAGIGGRVVRTEASTEGSKY